MIGSVDGELPECLHALEHAQRVRGVLLDDGPFLGVELAWLVENGVGNRQLAQVVQQRSAA